MGTRYINDEILDSTKALMLALSRKRFKHFGLVHLLTCLVVTSVAVIIIFFTHITFSNFQRWNTIILFTALIHTSSLSEKAPGLTNVLGLPSVSVEWDSGTGIQQI